MRYDLNSIECQDDPRCIAYGCRNIDFSRYVGISDYSIRTMANPENHALFWVRWGYDGGKIVRLPRGAQAWTEADEEVVYDFGMRSFYSPIYHTNLSSFFFVSDNNNDETFNIYRFCPGMRDISKITNVGYTIQYAFTPESNHLVFLGRQEKTGEVTGLYELDIISPEKVWPLHVDSEAYRIYPYSAPLIDAANERIAFVVKQNNSRSHQNLAIYTRSTGQIEIVTDPEIGRNFLHPLAWLDDRLLLINDEGTEKQALYRYDWGQRHLSLFVENPLQTAHGVFDPGTNRAMLEFRDGSVGEVLLIDADTGNVITRQDSGKYDFWWPDMCHPLGDGEYVVSTKIHGEREVLVCLLDAAARPDTDFLSVGFEPSINRHQADACEMEDVTYPTFDRTDDGKRRQIEAILFLPEGIAANPVERAAIVWAHGGPSARTTKSWHANIQLLTAMGYIVLGPNPRGSTGQGKEFEDLNNDDWGGGDYLDYEYGRRYLIARFGMPPARIGIAGFSFGGYMTNWAVTRPDGAFGFGISLAGMSDLAISIDESVVATSVISEMGDIEENEEIYCERSPINWVQHLEVPLLLIHGARDHRTSTNQSRLFYEKLHDLNKDVELVEVPGEGHGFRALKSQQLVFQHQARFLRRVAPID